MALYFSGMEGHEFYMERSIQLGKKALASGNPPVGSVIVQEGRIIGEGMESVKESGDVTRHAEIEAVRDAVRRGFSEKLRGSVLYTTHEPCIMCSYVIRHHGIDHIIYGVAVAYVGGDTSFFDVLATDRVPQWGGKPKITAGICREECEQLNREFRNRK